MPPPRTIRSDDTITLRRPSARDKAAYLELRRISQDFLEPTDPSDDETPPWNDPSHFDDYLKAARRKNASRTVIIRNEDKALLGSIDLSCIILGPLRSCYIGYWIGLPFARQGYMSRALPLMLEHAFEDLKLRRVEAGIMTTNKPSIALIKKFGFTKFGESRDYLLVQNKPTDHTHWSLLATDWRAAQKCNPRS